MVGANACGVFEMSPPSCLSEISVGQAGVDRYFFQECPFSGIQVVPRNVYFALSVVLGAFFVYEKESNHGKRTSQGL